MPTKLQNFLSLIQTYLERLEDEPYWGHLGEEGTGRLINAAINLTQKTKGDKGPPKTAEESFENFVAAISRESVKPIGPGRVKTLKEIWEASGKPFIKIDPKLAKEQPGYFRPEGQPKRFSAGSSLFSEVGKVPSYVSEQRFPVDTVGVHSPELTWPMTAPSEFDVRTIPSEVNEALGWAMGGGRENLLEDFFGEAAHAKQFGPDLYEHQYPVGTKITEQPSDYLEWAQPKTTESLQRFAERRSQLGLRGLSEELTHGDATYTTPEIRGKMPLEYAAHGPIETELKSLYKEKQAPREQEDVDYGRLSTLMALLELYGYGYGTFTAGGAPGKVAKKMALGFPVMYGPIMAK
jgi:hypothetical protein|tara:strand:- start:42 stop:1091 length:1050 start_codon:yes stop_codon:yes gene_type:complete